jgi:hypothetical protein
MRLRGGLGGFVAALAGAALTAGVIVPLAVGGSAAVPRARLAAAATQLPDFGNPNGHAPVPPAGHAVSTSHPNHVIGSGTPASCTSAAVVKAVAAGGIITFNCGPAPVTITLAATAGEGELLPSRCAARPAGDGEVSPSREYGRV